MPSSGPLNQRRLRVPEYFQYEENISRWTCLICPSKHLQLWEAIHHEGTQKHQTSIQRYIQREEEDDRMVARAYNEFRNDPFLRALLTGDTTEIPSQDTEDANSPNNHFNMSEPAPDLTEEQMPWWDNEVLRTQPWVVGKDKATELREKLHEMVVEGIGRDEPWHADEPAITRDADNSSSVFNSVPTNLEQSGTQRRRGGYQNPIWYPWGSRVECTFDIISNLPRSVHSEDDIELFTWMLKSNGVVDVPSVSQMKDVRKSMQRRYGIRTDEHLGILGHTFYVNNLGDILKQELANPLVCPHISFYPDLSTTKLREAKQGRKWLEHMDPLELTPMIRVHDQDFFIFEPARLTDGSCIMPTRWFTQEDRFGCEMFFGKGWVLSILTKDGYPGWSINQHLEITFGSTRLLWNFEQLLSLHSTADLPSPKSIWGYRNESQSEPLDALFRWDLDIHPLPNPWRTKAQGRRVLAVPIWLYCDDTSGNRSKKWNEHNSFLFTLAGLPRSESQRDYNIHFLCTSNLAPPLEMLEGVVNEIEQVVKNGVWAYHCVYKEIVLITTTVLALLGDNPMLSEFACHLGLRAKFFCRICHVKGRDVDDEKNNNDSTSAESEDSVREEEINIERPRSRKRATETINNLILRAGRAMEVGMPRNPQETRRVRAQIYELGKQPGTSEQRKRLRTQHGIKDTLLEGLLSRVDKAAKGKRGQLAAKATTDEFNKLPKAPERSPFSSVWRLRSLNPHTDTPIEILHVILLGMLKYFWRDAIDRLTVEEKELVKARLTSIDVTGLDPSVTKVPASTLVNYAGSLVGRDFRLVAQVAVFALYHLLDERIYSAWISLGNVVRLCWQPEIVELEIYVSNLTAAITDFLDKTALWSPRWFNKPKFHLLLHLIQQIPNFGPPILTATESFESYNAIIRSWSIHSNRQAPSRDIARAAAQWNRIRHIMSGGFFPDSEEVDKLEEFPETVHWRACNYAVSSLIDIPSVVTHKLGLKRQMPKVIGACSQVSFNRLPEVIWHGTLTSAVYPNPHSLFPLQTVSPLQDSMYKRAHKVVIANGDVVELTSYVVIAYRPEHKHIAVIEEIIRRKNSEADMNGQAEIVLARICQTRDTVSPYAMPRVVTTDQKVVVSPDNILCSVNVQHNCANNGCDRSNSRTIVQERKETDLREPSIRHYHLDDIILNTTKMRDSAIIQDFIPAIRTQDRAAVLAQAKHNHFHHPL